MAEDTVFGGSGEMRSIMRAHDWKSSPLGPVECWPQSLKATVRILLSSRFSMWMAWGPELVFLYNDTYRKVTLGEKHPWALGRPAREVWSEIWGEIGPRIQKVLDTGEATWDEGLLLFLKRSGFTEETYHTFSYSPLSDDSGKIAGMLCVVTEETERVLGERQLTSLRTFASELSTAITEEEVRRVIVASGPTNRRDLPFTLTYLVDEAERQARLFCATGFKEHDPMAPATIDLEDSGCIWPLSSLLATDEPLVVDVREVSDRLPTGAWEQPADKVLLVPIAQRGQQKAAGVLIAGLNPYRRLSGGYEGYIKLVAGQIAASLANANAYEEERKRAQALAEIDRAKTTFFNNVSHELRTPLTLMLGPLEDELARATSGTESKNSLELIHRNGLRLLKLVNTLLEFSRVESGRYSSRFEPVDLAKLTAEYASVFRSSVERGGLRFMVECQPLPQTVYVDREMWEKIILNLLSNALKSTFKGEIAVIVSPMETGARVVIRDTGTGIPEDEVPHLFERFRRVEGAKRRSHEGTGIGLALVHELVGIHGGTISVETKACVGTSFILTLPYGHAHLPQERISTAQAGEAPSSAATYIQEAINWLPEGIQGEADKEMADSVARDPHAAGAARVLLVDDNRDMRDYLSQLLSKKYIVDVAEDGKIALEKAVSRRPDLILTDVMMPEMDGFQLLAAVRQSATIRDVPVIMLSARAGEDSKVDGLDAGADDYLVKPFTARELLARVNAHLSLAALRAEGVKRERELLAAVQAERNHLQESEGRLRGIVEQIVSGICQLDRDGRLEFVNERFCEIADRKSEDLLGIRLSELVQPEDMEPGQTRFRELVKNGRTYEIVQRYKRAEAQPVWVQSNFSAVFDRDGNVDSVVCVTQDITERMVAEEALRRSEKLAAVGQLASTIAHEINNPLEAMTNLLYLMQGTDSFEELKEYAAVASEELMRVSHIVKTTLTFHREPREANLEKVSELLESAITVYQGRLRNASIQVIKCYRDRKAIRSNGVEMRQVFANLISNAFDATRNAVDRRIIVRARDATNSRTGVKGVNVTIADTGCGMDEDTATRIFEPFFTTKGNNGSGLGLWVSMDILKRHQAMVTLRSRPGRGTVFSVFFPAINSSQ